MAQRCRYRWKDAFPSVAKLSTILLVISIFVSLALCNDQFDQLEHGPFFSLIECSINDTALQIDKSSWITIGKYCVLGEKQFIKVKYQSLKAGQTSVLNASKT
ncbi:hypothetical protein D917_01086 [Trichinella nativa]|uniref:Uncharacterized protein n=1 Tax=Trichinella nativa TaxID=6335 RepID=A0A1Y3EU90_9BILA|nr:hypothetical protein D917_01086 [Trichinella nativa]